MVVLAVLAGRVEVKVTVSFTLAGAGCDYGQDFGISDCCVANKPRAQIMDVFCRHYGHPCRCANPAAYVHVNILCIANPRKRVSFANQDLTGPHQHTA